MREDVSLAVFAELFVGDDALVERIRFCLCVLVFRLVVLVVFVFVFVLSANTLNSGSQAGEQNRCDDVFRELDRKSVV